MTFYVSLVLVIVAAVTLVIGLLQSGLWLVIVSIGASFLAGVFLILTVMRERPRVEPAAAPAPAVPGAAPPAPTAPLVEEEPEFPIADYDDLKVSEIVPLLPELDDDELELVREHEEATKGRASVLNRIDELLGEEPAPAKKTPAKKTAAKAGGAKGGLPIANYDTLTVGDVAKRLTKLDEAELKQVRTYEKRNKSRKGVLDKIDAELARR